jgi:hypothetical protein
MEEAVSTRPLYETRARSSPRCLLQGFPQPVKESPMTRDEMNKEIEVLTAEIRTLSYSSTKEAAEKILQLQRRRRELRAQLEAAES